MVSKEYDSYIQDKDHPIWILELSNGEKIFQDDGRYKVTKNIDGKDIVIDDDPAWIRAKKYIEDNKLSIDGVVLRFRNNIVRVFSNLNNSVMFTRCVGRAAFTENETMFIQEPNQYYKIGVVSDGRVYVKKYKVPELIFETDEDYDTDNYLEENYIWVKEKQKVKQMPKK